MKRTLKLLSLLLLLGLGGCSYEYNYIVITKPKSEKTTKEIARTQKSDYKIDRWCNADIEKLRIISDSIAEKLNKKL